MRYFFPSRKKKKYSDITHTFEIDIDQCTSLSAVKKKEKKHFLQLLSKF